MKKNYLIVAIDGTHSDSEAYSGRNTFIEDRMERAGHGACVQNVSFTKDFAYSVIEKGDNKLILDGPTDGPRGSDSGAILSRASNWLFNKLVDKPQSEVILIGHSRGAHIVIALAKELRNLSRENFISINQKENINRMSMGGLRGDTRETSAVRALNGVAQNNPMTFHRPTKLGFPISFMGLYDAVDRTLEGGDTSVIPGNIQWFYHAVRSEALGSRSSFSNTGTNFEQWIGGQYLEREFMATHGAVGGAVPEACDEGWTWGKCKQDLTADQNFLAAQLAHTSVKGFAKNAGIPINY